MEKLNKFEISEIRFLLKDRVLLLNEQCNSYNDTYIKKVLQDDIKGINKIIKKLDYMYVNAKIK